METLKSLKTVMSEIPDWRKSKGKQYDLSDLLSLIIIGLICQANDYTGLSLFVKSKSSELSKHFKFPPKSLPSHDLFKQILEKVPPKLFAQATLKWLGYEAKSSDLLEQVAIDGKALRATRPGGSSPRSALQIVSAWLCEENLSIGQIFASGKTNELKVIPSLLAELDLQDKVVTIDAIGTKPVIAQQIIEQGGDYILALKKTIKTSTKK